jgi:AspBHI-like restriction endonuclease/restriction endonuclease
VDAIYEGGRKGNTSDDPITRLLRCGNQGGFRYVGSPTQSTLKLVVLYSTMDDVDWPDVLDEETGVFYYYGDNKRPGHDLHDTQRKGNLILRQVFEAAHQGTEARTRVPPIFLFTKAGRGRDVAFRGLAVPGAESVSSTEDLVAIWKSYGGSRFQNYRAIFTVLNVQRIDREWIDAILTGQPNQGAPSAWLRWVSGGVALPLKAARTLEYRRKHEQLPTTKHEQEMLDAIRNHFDEDPFAFERFAAELVKLADKNITAIEVTRPTRDGGRDALGEYRLALGRDRIALDFALEAKCYGTNSSVGVKETSRLISRLRHRQFGVLVTTSFVAEQAYQEIREDKHPIIIIAGADITSILIESGINSPEALRQLLATISGNSITPQS